MADGEAKEKDETLIGIDQRMVNQRGLLRMEVEVMLLEMIEENKDALDAVRRCTLKETTWQKMSICIKRKK